MEPRTACHELQYGDFHSVQGLLEAMKDYQQTAPDQLSNENLISILWNKVPIKLQKEVGEIKDWSLQELLHCLLRAEARVTECEQHNTQIVPKRRVYNGKGQTKTQGNRNVKTQEKSQAESDQKKGERKSNKAIAEMGMKGIKCYKCHKEGHIARSCPEANMISMGSGLGSLC